MLFGQLLLLCVWELGLRQFCQLFYSAIPQKCSSNLTGLLFQKSHLIILHTSLYTVKHVGVWSNFLRVWNEGPFASTFSFRWLVGWFGFSFVCNICWSGRLQKIQQRDHSWARASFIRVLLRIIFYLTCVGSEICTMTATIEITTRESQHPKGLHIHIQSIRA